MDKTIRKYSSLDAMKADELREWQRLPGITRLDAAAGLSVAAYQMKEPERDNVMSVDVLAGLKDRLAFVRTFYFTAAPGFEAIQRKCIPRSDQTDDDPIAFEEFQESTKGLDVLGHCSLSLVSKALEDYLREFILRKAGTLSELRGKGWFLKYESFLLTKTTFCWRECPVKRDQIEQINLCRNDFMHDPFIDRSKPKQSEDHHKKHPRSRFSDPLERAVQMAYAEVYSEAQEESPTSLIVTRLELVRAIGDVRSFCEFVEVQKTR